MMIFWIAVLLFAGMQAYVRFSPINPEDWTIDMPERAPGDYPSASGFMAVRIVDGTGAAFADAIDQAMLDLPRTRALGQVDGQRLYVSRSALWGFPDVTTIVLEPLADADQARAALYGRLRFGKSDMGVNKKRLKRVLSSIGQGAQG